MIEMVRGLVRPVLTAVGFGAVTYLVVMGKVEDVGQFPPPPSPSSQSPPPICSDGGTCATDGLELVSVKVRPPAGGGAASVIAPLALSPPRTPSGTRTRLSPPTVSGRTSTLAASVAPP